MANIKQVAELAGVSTATVSKYLNGIKVKDRNMQAIEAAVRTLEFSRNDIARGLRTKKSMTVGVLLPELNNLFFTSIISSVDEVIERYGYVTIVCSSHSDPVREAAKLAFLRQKKIDGLIAIPTSAPDEFIRNMPPDIPFVLIDRMSFEPTITPVCDFILADNADASRQAVEAFIRYGHKKIAILCGPASSCTPRERYAGYLDAMHAWHVIPDPALAKFGGYDVESGVRLTRELFVHPEGRPTALFATNNELTVGAVTALNELGLVPGRDISFIGFDNVEFAAAHNPKLTVIAQPVAGFGVTAASALLERMQGAPPQGIKRLAVTLIDNHSVIYPS